MKPNDHAVIESTLIAVEQYVTTLIHVAINPGPHGVAALDAARNNLIKMVEVLMIEANKK